RFLGACSTRMLQQRAREPERDRGPLRGMAADREVSLVMRSGLVDVVLAEPRVAGDEIDVAPYRLRRVADPVALVQPALLSPYRAPRAARRRAAGLRRDAHPPQAAPAGTTAYDQEPGCHADRGRPPSRYDQAA